jgi:hypothetical protein
MNQSKDTGMILNLWPIKLDHYNNGAPFDFEAINYGFGERLSNTPGVVREAVIQGEAYRILSEKIKKGQSIKVMWVEKEIPMGMSATYTMQFSLKNSVKIINHLNKDTFGK